MAKQEKHQFLSVRSVKNGWEIYTGSFASDMRSNENTYVFETWETLQTWLRANLADNENG